MNKKYVTVTEETVECANCGTVLVDDRFMERLSDCLVSHFDATVEIPEFDVQRVINGYPKDLIVLVDGVGYKLEISETWLY